MYKKITHNIVEEHFDHPMAGELKFAMEQAVVVSPDVDSAAAQAFKTESRNHFNKFAWRLRSYIVSLLDGAQDAAVIEEELFKNVDGIGRLVSPYYGANASALVSQHLRGIVVSLMEAVKTAKVNQSLNGAKLKISEHIGNLARLLSEANPKFWPEAAVAELLTKATDALLLQAESRVKKDWATDQRAADLAHEILVTGQPDGSSSFADVVSRGIIRQFPQKFS